MKILLKFFLKTETGILGEHGRRAQNLVAMELNLTQEIVQIHHPPEEA